MANTTLISLAQAQQQKALLEQDFQRMTTLKHELDGNGKPAPEKPRQQVIVDSAATRLLGEDHIKPSVQRGRLRSGSPAILQCCEKLLALVKKAKPLELFTF